MHVVKLILGKEIKLGENKHKQNRENETIKLYLFMYKMFGKRQHDCKRNKQRKKSRRKNNLKKQMIYYSGRVCNTFYINLNFI